MPVTAIHAAAVERLPWHHRDPFDRLLVAQASVEDCALVTSDRRLRKYAIETLW
jgi:PIN domain nuclease of toxin-antitoxin system